MKFVKSSMRNVHRLVAVSMQVKFNLILIRCLFLIHAFFFKNEDIFLLQIHRHEQDHQFIF